MTELNDLVPPQYCAPPQTSIPTRHSERFSKKASTQVRRNFRLTTEWLLLQYLDLNTRFAKSNSIIYFLVRFPLM